MKADWKQVQFYRFHYIMLTFILSSREPYLLHSFKMTLIVVGNKASLFCEFVCVFDYRWFCFVSINPRCQNKHHITGKQCIYLDSNLFEVDNSYHLNSWSFILFETVLYLIVNDSMQYSSYQWCFLYQQIMSQRPFFCNFSSFVCKNTNSIIPSKLVIPIQSKWRYCVHGMYTS